MDLGLRDKRVLVTGGSKGIGLASATRFAAEGSAVVIAGRRIEALDEARLSILSAAPGARVYTVAADVSTAEGTERLATEALEVLGGFDVLVNNAGTAAGGAFGGHSDAAWQADLDLKLFGAIRMSRLVLPEMIRAGGGHILNVTAIAGKAPGPGSSPTAISRAAGLALTKVLSKELAPHNILVNAVCIGLIRSEQIERAALTRFPDLPLDDALARMGEGIPLGRIGRPEEAGDLIAYLCSPRNSYVTGVAINIDGGTSPVL